MDFNYEEISSSRMYISMHLSRVWRKRAVSANQRMYQMQKNIHLRTASPGKPCLCIQAKDSLWGVLLPTKKDQNSQMR